MRSNQEEILNKLCLICKRPNRFHKAFWSPYQNCYVRQSISDDMAYYPLVASNDHYACIDNLEF
jgi:hypothetical protein